MTAGQQVCFKGARKVGYIAVNVGRREGDREATAGDAGVSNSVP